MKNKEIDLTIIVPIFNGAIHVESFYSKLSSAVEKIDRTYELVFIDDGSTDSTLEKLTRARERDNRLKIVSLNSNCGQQYALSKGIERASGKEIIILDDDQEYALEYIPLFLQEFEKRHDLILGWRRKRNISVLRKIGTWATNILISVMIKKRIHDIGGPKAFGSRGTYLLRKRGSFLNALTHLKYLNIQEIKISDYSTSLSRYNLKKLLQLFFQILSAALGCNPLEKYKKIKTRVLLVNSE